MPGSQRLPEPGGRKSRQRARSHCELRLSLQLRCVSPGLARDIDGDRLYTRSRRRPGAEWRNTDDVSPDVLSPPHPATALYSIDVMGGVERADLNDAPSVMQIITLCTEHMRAQGINQWDQIYPNLQVVEDDARWLTVRGAPREPVHRRRGPE